MKFKMPRQIISQDIKKVVSKVKKEQKCIITRANKNNLIELAEACSAIQKLGLPKQLVCKKLPNGLGHGVFLHPKADPIVKGQVIASYAGELSFVVQNEPDDSAYAFALISNVLLTKEEQELLDPRHHYHPRRLYSLNLDAHKKGNFTRFINHSETPNIVAELFEIPANAYGLAPSPIEVVYFAKKTIHPGEQLLVCYEDEEKSYWGALKIKPVPINPKTFTLSASLKLIY